MPGRREASVADYNMSGAHVAQDAIVPYRARHLIARGHRGTRAASFQSGRHRPKEDARGF